MSQLLVRQYQNLQSRYESLKNDLMPLEEELLNHHRKPGKWSPLQIIYHLQLSESLTIDSIRKKMAAERRPATGLKHALRYRLMHWVLASPLKYKAPAAVGENLPDNLQKNVLFADYDEVRASLKAMLDSFPSGRMKDEIFRHPKVGYLNISQSVGFLEDHFIHHEKQIRSIIS